jgi:hypothetical protein
MILNHIVSSAFARERFAWYSEYQASTKRIVSSYPCNPPRKRLRWDPCEKHDYWQHMSNVAVAGRESLVLRDDCIRSNRRRSISQVSTGVVAVDTSASAPCLQFPWNTTYYYLCTTGRFSHRPGYRVDAQSSHGPANRKPACWYKQRHDPGGDCWTCGRDLVVVAAGANQ